MLGRSRWEERRVGPGEYAVFTPGKTGSQAIPTGAWLRLCGEETVEGKTEKWVSSRKLLGHPGKGTEGSGAAVRVASTARVGPLTTCGVRKRQESGETRGSRDQEPRSAE